MKDINSKLNSASGWYDGLKNSSCKNGSIIDLLASHFVQHKNTRSATKGLCDIADQYPLDKSIINITSSLKYLANEMDPTTFSGSAHNHTARIRYADKLLTIVKSVFAKHNIVIESEKDILNGFEQISAQYENIQFNPAERQIANFFLKLLRLNLTQLYITINTLKNNTSKHKRGTEIEDIDVLIDIKEKATNMVNNDHLLDESDLNKFSSALAQVQLQEKQEQEQALAKKAAHFADNKKRCESAIKTFSVASIAIGAYFLGTAATSAVLPVMLIGAGAIAIVASEPIARLAAEQISNSFTHAATRSAALSTGHAI